MQAHPAIKIAVVLMFVLLLSLFVASKSGMISDKPGIIRLTGPGEMVTDTPTPQSNHKYIRDTITLTDFQANEKAKFMAMSSKSAPVAGGVNSWDELKPIDTITIDGTQWVIVDRLDIILD